ncbi:MAG TPA: class I SAM-dependent methyltransferase [Acidimicrobiia bacterium]|nr:class I SAM-dependent methyltransferase [Acidimicrobiia bacterium]
MDSTTNESLWEQHAGWWQREFSAGADPEYEEQILPLVAAHLGRVRRVLDVGCGEGQVARHLARQGVDVVGLDPTWSQLGAATARAGGPAYARARADALPCRDEAFDAVLVCLAFEHVDRFETAIRDVARVLEPGGTFLLLLCHPLLQAPGSGWIDDRTSGEHYWRVGGYLGDHAVVDEVGPGVSLRFLHRPLSRYVNAMGDAGLLIDHMEEPPPPPRLLAEIWDHAEAATIPRVLLVRARRVRSGAPWLTGNSTVPGSRRCDR